MNPMRAISIALLSISVANICTLKFFFASFIHSCNIIATEYASSPVEHPGTQILILLFSGLVFTNSDNIFFNFSKDSGSLKKFVTPIKSSLNKLFNFCRIFLKQPNIIWNTIQLRNIHSSFNAS